MLAAGCLLGLAACGGIGVDPPTDRFFNPVALAVDPAGHYLLVANGDFGLAYSAATLVPVDLDRVGDLLGDLRGPRALEGAPVDLAGTLMPGRTVRVEAFSSRLRIHPQRQWAYLSSRGANAIYALRLQHGDDGSLQGLDCGGEAEPLQTCAEERLIEATNPEAPESPLSEPFALQFVQRPAASGAGAPSEALVASYLRSGDLALFPLDETGGPHFGGAQAAHLDLDVASRELAVHPDGRQIYVATRDGAALRWVRAEHDDAGWALDDRGSVGTGDTGSLSASELRAVAVSPSGDRIFAARRHLSTASGSEPADLVVLRRSMNESGGEALDLAAVMPLDERPISLTYVPGAQLYPSDDPPATRPVDLLLALCYDSGRLLVIDAENLLLLGAVELGKTPYDLAVAPLGGAPDLPPGGGLGLVYVTHFRDDRISVVGLDPRSPNWLRVIGSIH